MKKFNTDDILVFIKKYGYYIGFITVGVLALIWDYNHSVATQKVNLREPESVDTYIPEGFVLVPIEIQNLEALEAMLGRYGIVDLYTFNSQNPEHSRKIAEKVKILRAPLNPRQFAVLVPESDSTHLVAQPGPFFVMIQNPNQRGTNFEKKIMKKKNIIVLED